MKMMEEKPPALPLWINGRAYLHVPQAFFDITDPDGKIVRRTPLCNAEIATQVTDIAVAALPGWQALPRNEKIKLLHALADQLEVYRNHFAALLAEEGCKDPQTELSEALKNLRAEIEPGLVHGVFVLVALREEGAFASVCAALHALLQEDVGVILLPNPGAPSAFLALAELATRQGLPNGIFNVVFGDEAFAETLSALPQITQTLRRGKPNIHHEHA